MELPKTLMTIQALRAVAAIAVVAHHTQYMLAHNAGYSLPVSYLGASGVDLFFFISGFIMVYTTRDSFCSPGASLTFVRRRAIRIMPTYWFYTTVAVLLLAFAPKLFSSARFDWGNVISSYLFLLSEITPNNYGTILQTGWTLCYEVYFYALFSFLLILPRKYLLPVSLAVFVSGIALGQFASLPGWARVVANPILFEFWCGMALAMPAIQGHRLPRGLALPVMILGFAAITALHGLNFGVWTQLICIMLPCAAIIAGAVSFEHSGHAIPSFATALGDSSYSLYLSHPFILPAFGKLWSYAGLTSSTPPAVPFLLSLGTAILVGHGLYIAIEKPITKRLSRSRVGVKRELMVAERSA